MEKLNIQTQHVAQVVCAFMAAAVRVNIIKSFRNSRSDIIVDENSLLCRVIPGLTLCLQNPTCLQPISIPEETEGEAMEAIWNSMWKYCGNMELDVEVLWARVQSQGRGRRKGHE
jgi:hypothetical protein